MNKIYVIGIGYKALDNRAREIVLASEIILASKRLFEVFKKYEEYESVKDKVRMINNVDETIKFIHSSLVTRHSSLPIVLLASGDPTFFGIGRRAVMEFGKDTVEIIPDLSCIQLAFSRIKESWDDAFLMSLHGGPDPEKRRRLPYEINDIPYLLRKYSKIAILTDKENNPSVIAKFLNSSPITRHSSLEMFVCEKLGYADEKITEGSPEKIAGMTFSEPSVVIIKNEKTSSMSFPLACLCVQARRQVGNPSELHEDSKKDCGQAAMTNVIRFGLTENEIAHSRGLITKDEVRAVTIHKLRLPSRGVLWDIGAGSGSVSMEVAILNPELRVLAIEKDKERVKNIEDNRIRFGASNIEIIRGSAPDVLTNLPSPDRVFIGGSGGKLKEIIDLIVKMQTAIIVINAVTIETLNAAVRNLENRGFSVEVSEVSVSRSKTVAGKRHMSALNPIFIVTGERRE